MNSRIHQLLNQVVGEQTLPDLIDRGLHLLSFDLEGDPGMIAAGQMVTLRAGLTTLAFFRTRQLLEASMEFFHLPPVVVFDLSDKQIYSVVKVICDDPVNVAVWGDHLEKLYHERTFFQLDYQTLDQRVLVKAQLFQVLVADGRIKIHQAVALQRPPLRCGEESPPAAVNQLEVGHRGVPSVKKYRLGFEPLVGHQALEHFLEMVILGLAVILGTVDAVVDGPEIAVVSRGVHEINQADPLDRTMFITRVLSLDQFNEVGVLLILHAVVSNDDRGFRVLNVRDDRSPQLRRREAFTPQEVTDRIVAQVGLMIGKVRAGVIERRAQQVLYVVFFL